MKQLKDETQDGAWKVDGAELHQLKIVGSVLRVEEQATFTKFDVEDSTGVVEVNLLLGNGVDIAERSAASRYALSLAKSLLYPPIGKRQNTKRRDFLKTLHVCVRLI